MDKRGDAGECRLGPSVSGDSALPGTGAATAKKRCRAKKKSEIVPTTGIRERINPDVGEETSNEAEKNEEAMEKAMEEPWGMAHQGAQFGWGLMGAPSNHQ